MTFSLLNGMFDQKHSDEEHSDLEAVEVQSHGVAAKTS